MLERYRPEVVEFLGRWRLRRMSFQHLIWLYLWVAPHLLLAAVAVVMFRNRRYKDFPIFFSYILFEFLQFCILFTMRFAEPSPSTYLKVDMLGLAGSIALRFGILREMFEAPVAHSAPLRQTMGRLLKWLTAALVALAAMFIGSLYYSVVGHKDLQAYVTIETLNVAQCGLLVLVFLWHRFLGLRVSLFVFGIAVGMGLVAGIAPLMHVWKDSVSAQNGKIVDIFDMAIYHCAVLIWLFFAQARERATSNTEAVPLLDVREAAADLGRIVHL